MGSQLMDKSEVQSAIKEMQACGLTMRYRMNRVKSHVDNRDPNVSLKALDMSFKLDGSYAPEKLEVQSFNEYRAVMLQAAADLEGLKRLEAMLAEGLTADET